MFKRIVIGVCDQQGGCDAIALARRLSAPDATITAVTVYPNEPIRWRGATPFYEEVELQHANDLLNELQARAGIELQIRPIAADSTGHGLHVAAEEADADLLVLGSSRRGLLGRVFIGDDTRAALDGAPCPAAIAPAGYTRHARPILRIGVGYNGSAQSEYALTVARGLAADLKADLSALEAVEIPTYAFTAAYVPMSVDFIDDMVDAALKRVSALPGVEPHAAYGRAAEELTHYSASVDLLVVGSRGYGALGRLVHGSTTTELARTACCPLLVLVRSRQEPQSEESETGAGAVQDTRAAANVPSRL